MSNLWQKSNFYSGKPPWKVTQAGAVHARDLEEGEAPPALYVHVRMWSLLPVAWPCFKGNASGFGCVMFE